MAYGNDYCKPVMYQDIASACMQPMPMVGMYPAAGYGGNTNMLGGVKMNKQLDADRYQKMQEKEQKDWNFFKKAGLVVLGLAAIGFIKFAPIKKWVGSKCTKVIDWCKNLFKKAPPTPPPTPPAP